VRGRADGTTWIGRTAVEVHLCVVYYVVLEGYSLLGERLGGLRVSQVGVTVVLVGFSTARKEHTLSTDTLCADLQDCRRFSLVSFYNKMVKTIIVPFTE